MGLVSGTLKFIELVTTNDWSEVVMPLAMLAVVFLLNVPFRNFLSGRPLLEGWLEKTGTDMILIMVAFTIGAMFGAMWVGLVQGC